MVKKILICLVCVLCCSCVSTGRGADKSVIEHQRKLGEYQAAVSYHLGRVDACAARIADIRERADSLTGEIDRVIELFDEYQRAVEQLIREYNTLRDTVEAKNEAMYGALSDSIHNDIDKTDRLLSLLEGD
jgi:predicted nuclease with TOPRIM domain